MESHQLINLIIERNKFSKYLEIGISTGYTFTRVKADIKDSVDPYFDNEFYNMDGYVEYPVKYRITSDEFFDTIAPTLGYKYDLIFIDGLHISEQVDKDIENSLKYLNEDGVVILHDCNPKKEYQQIIPRTQGEWYGDVWKSFVKFVHYNNSEYICFIIDADTGIGLITKNTRYINLDKLINTDIQIEDKLHWENFKSRKTEMVNIITSTDLILNEYKGIL